MIKFSNKSNIKNLYRIKSFLHNVNILIEIIIIEIIIIMNKYYLNRNNLHFLYI